MAELFFILAAIVLLARWTQLEMWRTYPCYYMALALTVLFTLLPNPADPWLWGLAWIATAAMTNSLRWLGGIEAFWLATLGMDQKELRLLVLALTSLAAAIILAGAVARPVSPVEMFTVLVQCAQLAAFLAFTIALVYLWNRGTHLEPNTRWQLSLVTLQLGIRSFFALAEPQTGLLHWHLFSSQAETLRGDELCEGLLYLAWAWLVQAPERHWWARRAPAMIER